MTPPRLPRWLLRRAAPPEDRAALIGDPDIVLGVDRDAMRLDLMADDIGADNDIQDCNQVTIAIVEGEACGAVFLAEHVIQICEAQRIRGQRIPVLGDDGLERARVAGAEIGDPARGVGQRIAIDQRASVGIDRRQHLDVTVPHRLGDALHQQVAPEHRVRRRPAVQQVCGIL